MSVKCIVFGCNNTTSQGSFVGELCLSCYHMITGGKVGQGNTFVHKLKQQRDKLLETANHGVQCNYYDWTNECIGKCTCGFTGLKDEIKNEKF